MNKHTPGPWEVEISQGHYPVITSQKFDIAQVLPLGSGERIDDEGEEANARLIAAAPEMLEQLKSINKAIMEGYFNPDHIKTSNDIIAKAEGK